MWIESYAAIVGAHMGGFFSIAPHRFCKMYYRMSRVFINNLNNHTLNKNIIIIYFRVERMIPRTRVCKSIWHSYTCNQILRLPKRVFYCVSSFYISTRTIAPTCISTKLGEYWIFKEWRLWVIGVNGILCPQGIYANQGNY